MGVLKKIKSFFTMDDEYEEIHIPEQAIEKDEGQGNVVNLTTLQQKTAKMVLYEPRTYGEAQEIADHIVNRRSVVINLQRLEHDQATRIVDFLSGTVYAVNGNIEKLGSETFLCTPDNIEVSGTISDSLTDETDFDKGW